MAEKQVFQSNSPRRWRVFQWSTRLILFGVLMTIPVFWIALSRSYKPMLPLLTNDEFTYKKLQKPDSARAFSAKESKKYKGFKDFMEAKNALKNGANPPKAQSIRAGFYVNWDAQSLFSLETNIDKMNMVIPEWLSIDPKTDTLLVNIDADALRVMQAHKVAILPILNNVNDSKDGDFDPQLLSRVLKNPAKSRRLIDDLLKVLKQYNFQGVNIDFEAVDDKATALALENFQREVYKRLHTEGGVFGDARRNGIE
jgi:peptidoglycan-N-acetylglucosamine deacetylase